ncbi:MAG: magnesium chelatase ATPase subunit D, partial [Pseudomonadota bacterium]
MAEKLSVSAAASIAHALDHREVVIEREGVSDRSTSGFALLLMDEGIEGESPPMALLERLAFHLPLDNVPMSCTDKFRVTESDVSTARHLLPSITVSEEGLSALNAAALEAGVNSIRALHFCCRAASAHAALAGRGTVQETDLAIACRLVLGPRAAIEMPEEEADQDSSPPVPDDDPQEA